MSSSGWSAGQLPAAVGAALADLSRAVDALQTESLDGLDDSGVLTVLRELETVRRRMSTVDHRMIAELECRSTASRFLTRGVAGLLTELLHVDVAEARARVRAAGLLGPRTAMTGEPLAPVYPATAAAQAEGTVSEKHAKIITSTIGQFPHSIDEDTAALAERTLVAQAQGLRPSELTRVAERLAACLDPDGQLSDDRDRAARRALTIGRQRADGMSSITGLLDPATRALVDAAFSSLARPTAEGDLPDPRSAAQRNHDALGALCRNALASGTLPSHRGRSQRRRRADRAGRGELEAGHDRRTPQACRMTVHYGLCASTRHRLARSMQTFGTVHTEDARMRMRPVTWRCARENVRWTENEQAPKFLDSINQTSPLNDIHG